MRAKRKRPSDLRRSALKDVCLNQVRRQVRNGWTISVHAAMDVVVTFEDRTLRSDLIGYSVFACSSAQFQFHVPD